MPADSKHCVEPIADVFVKYLHSPHAQEVFAQRRAHAGLIDITEAKKGTDAVPPIDDLFTTDDLGGWDALIKDTVFGPDGAFTKAFAAAQGVDGAADALTRASGPRPEGSGRGPRPLGPSRHRRCSIWGCSCSCRSWSSCSAATAMG